jgi:Flp pilus assembly protein TadG
MRKGSFIDRHTVREPAQALIEFALILPVMLIMVLGGIDIGRGLVYGVAVQDGAREAARLGASGSVTDIAVLTRLINASAPALVESATCRPTAAAAQTCGGATWNFSIQDVTTDPITHVQTTYTSLVTAQNDANFSGSQLTVTATGQVSMLAGFSAWGMNLFPITARGQAVMVVL